MRLAVREFESVWRWAWIRAHPARFAGVVLHLLLRTLFAVFWLAAGINKVRNEWLTSDILKEIFPRPPDRDAARRLRVAVPAEFRHSAVRAGGVGDHRGRNLLGRGIAAGA